MNALITTQPYRIEDLHRKETPGATAWIGWIYLGDERVGLAEQTHADEDPEVNFEILQDREDFWATAQDFYPDLPPRRAAALFAFDLAVLADLSDRYGTSYLLPQDISGDAPSPSDAARIRTSEPDNASSMMGMLLNDPDFEGAWVFAHDDRLFIRVQTAS